MRFTGANFLNGGNNAAFTVDTVTASVVTVVDNTGMVDETGTGDETLTSNGHDYTVVNATGGAAEAGNSMYVSYIDKAATTTQESFTSVFLATRNLFIRVRDGVVDANGPIQTFETTGVLGTAGGSATAIRTPDS
jgi:hypothetical protein